MTVITKAHALKAPNTICLIDVDQISATW
jgi:hypothetical protein